MLVAAVFLGSKGMLVTMQPSFSHSHGHTMGTQQELHWSVKPILHTFYTKLTFLQSSFEF